MPGARSHEEDDGANDLTPEAFLQVADIDKDGKISLEEMKQFVARDFSLDEEGESHNKAQVSLLETDQGAALSLSEMKSTGAAIFARVDLNKDGFLDSEELPSFLDALDDHVAVQEEGEEADVDFEEDGADLPQGIAAE